MLHDASVCRRSVLLLLGDSAALVVDTRLVGAAEPRIEGLIAQSRGKGTISQRIDFISAVLRGIQYQGNTLIGGPNRSEKFVVRDDAFDCVTFCEIVLAAAIASDRSEFDTVLRNIRYHNGVVASCVCYHFLFGVW